MARLKQSQLQQIFLRDAEKASQSKKQLYERARALKSAPKGSILNTLIAAGVGFLTGGPAGAAVGAFSSAATGGKATSPLEPIMQGFSAGSNLKAITGGGSALAKAATGAGKAAGATAGKGGILEAITGGVKDIGGQIGGQISKFAEPTQLKEKAAFLKGLTSPEQGLQAMSTIEDLQGRRAASAGKGATSALEKEKLIASIAKIKAETDSLAKKTEEKEDKFISGSNITTLIKEDQLNNPKRSIADSAILVSNGLESAGFKIKRFPKEDSIIKEIEAPTGNKMSGFLSGIYKMISGNAASMSGPSISSQIREKEKNKSVLSEGKEIAGGSTSLELLGSKSIPGIGLTEVYKDKNNNFWRKDKNGEYIAIKPRRA